ncbi:MAG: hypothetical protein LBP35_00155 [Candidatus Ancillula trichonymphae]|nr:hypothetical protein [Candidatus Ancillula trichonymphae]
MTCGREDEDSFRPDITIFVNGLPLSFVEVKKPSNPEGIKAERDRINTRFKNDKFRKYINITQLLVFPTTCNMTTQDKINSKAHFMLQLVNPKPSLTTSPRGVVFRAD